MEIITMFYVKYVVLCVAVISVIAFAKAYWNGIEDAELVSELTVF